MYHTNFILSKAKFLIRRGTTEIYTYTLEDAKTYMLNNLTAYYSGRRLMEAPYHDRINMLFRELFSYSIESLETGTMLLKNPVPYAYYASYKRVYPLAGYFERVIYHIASKKRMNTQRKLDYFEIDHPYHCFWQGRPLHHGYICKCCGVNKRTKIADSSDDAIAYVPISKRQTDNHFHEHRTDGSWKNNYKCRKQWSKHMMNPSYEKLSKIVWKREYKL